MSSPGLEIESPYGTPNTRKRKQLDYANLNSFGKEGPPVSPTPLRKRPHIQQEASQASESKISLSQATEDSEALAIVVDIQQEPSSEVNKLGGKKGRAWLWQYFTAVDLETTYKRKSGKEVFDIQYTCNVKTSCNFKRLASKVYDSTTPFAVHLKKDHGITEASGSHTGVKDNQKGLLEFIKKESDIPPFEEALLDWIVHECQPFTATESV
jgi:hypothetical protein